MKYIKIVALTVSFLMSAGVVGVSASDDVSGAEKKEAVDATPCLIPGEYGERSKIPKHCYEGRGNAFGWGDTRELACKGARNEMAAFGDDNKNPTGCYCAENGSVNGQTVPHICWVLFDY